MNQQSSRSHSIICFDIESQELTAANSAPITIGKLNLVDLAGSERLNKSGAEGERQKEAQEINSSLTALGDVLQALSTANFTGVVPYRNSKLTRLLQDSIGGNSKTFFVINIQTSAVNYRETMQSLMYGSRMKKIQNRSMINKDFGPDSHLQNLYDEISSLKQKLSERTKQVEEISNGSSVLELCQENKILKQKLDTLALLNSSPSQDLSKQVFHSHEIAEQRYAYTELQNQLDENRKTIHTLRLQLMSEQDEVTDLKEQLQQCRSDLEQALSDLDDVKSDQVDTKSLKSKHDSAVKKLEQTVIKQAQQIKTLETELEERKKKLAKADDKEDKIKELEDLVAKFKKTHDKESESTKKNYLKLQKQYEDLEKENERKDKALEQFEDREKRDREERERERGEFKKKITQLERDLKKVQDRDEKREGELKEIKDREKKEREERERERDREKEQREKEREREREREKDSEKESVSKKKKSKRSIDEVDEPEKKSRKKKSRVSEQDDASADAVEQEKPKKRTSKSKKESANKENQADNEFKAPTTNTTTKPTSSTLTKQTLIPASPHRLATASSALATSSPLRPHHPTVSSPLRGNATINGSDSNDGKRRKLLGSASVVSLSPMQDDASKNAAKTSVRPKKAPGQSLKELFQVGDFRIPKLKGK